VAGTFPGKVPATFSRLPRGARSVEARREARFLKVAGTFPAKVPATFFGFLSVVR